MRKQHKNKILQLAMKELYYLYCLKDKTQRKFSLVGLDGKKVYTFPCENIEAVITDVNSKEFNQKKIKSKLEDSKWTEEKVRNHEAVIEEAMNDGPVIPLKFLTLYKSKVSLNNTLKKKYEEFQKLLNKLRGKAEWGLKVFLIDREKFIETIKREDEEIAKTRNEISSKPEGVKYFLENFGKKFTPYQNKAVLAGKKIFEIITMASLLEKEVNTFDDKKMVSGILWKRLENKIPLQVDATISYVTGKRTTRISIEETKIDSPYNTYKYLGLPIGPISNPGLESILAAISPQKSDFWYYLSTPEGETIFNKTLEDHNVDRAEFLR